MYGGHDREEAISVLGAHRSGFWTLGVFSWWHLKARKGHRKLNHGVCTEECAVPGLAGPLRVTGPVLLAHPGERGGSLLIFVTSRLRFSLFFLARAAQEEGPDVVTVRRGWPSLPLSSCLV